MSRFLHRLPRGWLFRLLAVLVGLVPFAVAEIGLRIAGTFADQPASDASVEFAAVRPLFVLNASGDRWEIPPSRQPYFKPDSFAARKSSRGFRIFCLGGSTVQGNPYSTETAFSTWLKLSLQAADPQRDWEVINCGGISYASYRLEQILRECLRHDPDLLVLYMGHNEFLEDRSIGSWRQVPSPLVGLTQWIGNLQLYRGVVHLLARDATVGDRPTRLAAEVDALLDYQGGLARYHRDDVWQAGVARQFHQTLHSMVRQAQQHDVPVLLADPVANIRDCPPFKVQVDPHLSAADRMQVETLLAQALEPDSGSSQRVAWLERAVALDPRNAAAQFHLGRALLEVGQDEEARRALVRAKDEDICPLRLTELLREVIADTARETGTSLVPINARFSALSPHGIPGDELLLDHVHPTISGHQLIADMLLQAMIERKWLTPQDDWQARQKQAYASHLATLDAPYYARGQEHLEGLRRWAQGRVTKVRTAPSAAGR